MNKYLSGLLLALIIVIAGCSSVHAANISGWAWSETLGWISFNSADAGAGGGPYAVAVDASGNWSGYAWSEYLGWVSFGVADANAAGCAAATGHANQVTMPLSGGTVSGTAYAKVYGTSADGCIEMSGTTHTVSYDSGTGRITGYAWGGDTTAKTGPGWIDMSANGGTNGVTFSGGGGPTINGSCLATTPYQNIAPNTSVTFQAAASNGTSPYEYSWSGNATTTQNTYSLPYSASAPGPTVRIGDSSSPTKGYSASISCPSVTVLAPIGASNVLIGKTVATASTNSFTVKQNSPFAVVWNLTVADDYTCGTTIGNDPNLANWNSNWKGLTLASSDNGDGTVTYAGNTAATLSTGNVASGIYQFGIVCTSATSPTQSTSATLKVNNSSENEI